MATFQGKMFIFTAPSGAGKTTIVRYLLNKYHELDFSVSATTRAKRDYEVHGRDYYFMDTSEFMSRVGNDEFVEWEEVYQNQFYGTLKSEVERIWSQDRHLVFDIDVKGAQKIKQLYGNQCLSVFIRPPSLEALIDRLVNRNTETEETLIKRISKVKKEMEYQENFDMVLVNDQLELAFKEADHIVETFLYGIPQS